MLADRKDDLSTGAGNLGCRLRGQAPLGVLAEDSLERDKVWPYDRQSLTEPLCRQIRQIRSSDANR